MRYLIKTFAALFMVSVVVIACKKNAKISQSEVPEAVMAKITSMGFSTDGIQKVSEGYLVEGDIILRESDLQSAATSPEMVIANEEHYRTTNTVFTGGQRNLTVAVTTTAPSYFFTAADSAIARYNAENLQLTFTRITQNGTNNAADINIVVFYQVSNVLGSSGFPSGGNPYPQVQMNSYWYSASTSIDYMATIVAHEMGHCIGYRHTDYMNRKYSCGGRPVNEGNAGVGAIWIPETPTGPDAGSWMLACIGSGVNRPFTANDKVALNYLY